MIVWYRLINKLTTSKSYNFPYKKEKRSLTILSDPATLFCCKTYSSHFVHLLFCWKKEEGMYKYDILIKRSNVSNEINKKNYKIFILKTKNHIIK